MYNLLKCIQYPYYRYRANNVWKRNNYEKGRMKDNNMVNMDDVYGLNALNYNRNNIL